MGYRCEQSCCAMRGSSSSIIILFQRFLAANIASLALERAGGWGNEARIVGHVGPGWRDMVQQVSVFMSSLRRTVAVIEHSILSCVCVCVVSVCRCGCANMLSLTTEPILAVSNLSVSRSFFSLLSAQIISAIPCGGSGLVSRLEGGHKADRKAEEKVGELPIGNLNR